MVENLELCDSSNGMWSISFDCEYGHIEIMWSDNDCCGYSKFFVNGIEREHEPPNELNNVLRQKLKDKRVLKVSWANREGKGTWEDDQGWACIDIKTEDETIELDICSIHNGYYPCHVYVEWGDYSDTQDI